MTDHTTSIPASAAQRMRTSARWRNLQSIAMFALALTAVVVVDRMSDAGWTIFGICAVSYLGFKLVLALTYRTADLAPPAGLRTAVIIPAYNEDPAALRACIESILDQSHPVDEIWVIDDGSTSLECEHVARRALAGVPGAVVHRLAANAGKRHAQGFAMRRTRADIIVTVDSDTILDRDAILEGLRPFADPTVTAVTGNVRVLNADVNVLTRLTSLRYANAFLWERAAYSRLGSVLCCCGSLSFWRADIVRANLDDYLTQTFLGVQVPYGDDRRLTNYSLIEGRVVLQDTSIGYTAVPERMNHYLRQQVRWNKSFFRETIWALRNFSAIRAVWVLTLAEVGLWLTCFASILVVHAWRPTVTGELATYVVVFGTIMAYARSIRYLGSEDRPLRHQLGTFALAPAYWLLSTFLLIPLRFVSLLSLKSGSWGTRASVEVSLERSPGAAFETSPLSIAGPIRWEELDERADVALIETARLARLARRGPRIDAPIPTAVAGS